MIKYTNTIIIIILSVIILLLVNRSCNSENKFNNYENTIKALNDTIIHTKENNKDKYIIKSPEIDLKQLLNSEAYKTLTKEKKAYYNELKHLKGLIANNQIQLELKQTIIDSISKGVIDTINNNICYYKNDSIIIQDTTQLFKYQAVILFNNPLLFKLTYDYKPIIESSFIRHKDKSITVEYTLNDPNLKVNNINSFIIPIENDKGGVLKKWINKHKIPINIVFSGIILSTGIYIGTNLK